LAAIALLIGMVASIGIVQPLPARAQTAMPATAELTPANVLVYLSLSIDPSSPQLVQGDDVLNRLGLQDVFDSMVDDANGTVTGGRVSIWRTDSRTAKSRS